MIGYKAFNKDMTCSLGNGIYQYEVGKTYEEDKMPKARSNGFHFCTNIIDTLAFYGLGSVVCEIEALGNIEGDGLAYATDKIRIVRRLKNGDKDLRGNTYNTLYDDSDEGE